MRKLLALFFLWLALLLAVGFNSENLSKNPVAKCTIKKQLPFYRWDSFWYTSIARHGYFFSQSKNSSIAFFPFYPLVVRMVWEVFTFKQDQLSLALNILFSFLALLFLYKLAKLDYDEKTSSDIALVWLFFPPAYFLLSGYPEALFVLLAVLSFFLPERAGGSVLEFFPRFWQ